VKWDYERLVILWFWSCLGLVALIVAGLLVGQAWAIWKAVAL